MDILTTMADRVLRSFVLLLAIEPTELNQNCVSALQHVVAILGSITCLLSAGSYGYCVPLNFTGALGRPKIMITRGILNYFFSNGFSASTIAMLLQVSLSTVRRQMCEYDMRIMDTYSSQNWTG